MLQLCIEAGLFAYKHVCFALRQNRPSSSVNTAAVGFFVFFQNATRARKSVLLKQKEDIGYLSRHLDHVISFAKLATARNQAMALLHCKRLVRLPRSFIYSTESCRSPVTKWGHTVLMHRCLSLKND